MNHTPSSRTSTRALIESLPLHFDSAGAEKRWSERWERDGLYRYDSRRGRSETFVVDTPPPTVSGSLHVGHVFSYTHTDVLVRYQRESRTRGVEHTGLRASTVAYSWVQSTDSPIRLHSSLNARSSTSVRRSQSARKLGRDILVVQNDAAAMQACSALRTA
jgi:hypothetical protein